MKRFDFRAGALALVVVLLSGCEYMKGLGVPEPRDFPDRASLAYDIADGGVAMVVDLNQAGELEDDEANALIDTLDGYKSGIDIAIAAWSVNQADGEARLATIRAKLDELIEDLRNRGEPDVE